MEIGIELTLNGRILNRRRMGRASFIDILSNGETVQLFANNSVDGYDELIGLPIGSFIRVEGETFLTRTGHPTLRIESYETLLVPERALPIVRDDGENTYNDTTDVESIRRRRYLRTILNGEERDAFVLRSRLIQLIRNFFVDREYLEVETPILQPVYGGAEATPFVTRFEAMDSDFYLRIAPELYLRRMLIGGYERVFEIGRNFRNEGISNRHNPEFTFIEIYTAFEDYRFSIDLTRDLLLEIGETFGSELTYGEHSIDLSDIRVASYMDLVLDVLNEDRDITEHYVPGDLNDEMLVEIFESRVEPTLINPTIVVDYPTSISPLALPSSSNPEIAERFELFIGGMEIGNAYSELNDVSLHVENLGDDDSDFIEALEYGMPPATGIGFGIDRLVMLLTNRNIRDSIYFPAMRRENGNG